MPTPNITELPIEQQVQIWDQLVAAEQKFGRSVNVGLLGSAGIDGYKVRAYKAVSAFRTVDSDTLQVKQDAVVLAKHDDPVLITGESGTGKELLANILHGTREGQFVAVNVCSIVDTLFESELFGHTKGSFTGADRERLGLIKQADGGTLFLDEIGDMPQSLQIKLLRVIQTRMFRKVGGNTDEPLRCRIVAATHQDIRSMIVEKRFRLDLYERLSVFKLHIKPLRERWSDSKEIVRNEVIDKINSFSTETVRMSGNVRQLLNLAKRAEVLGIDRIKVEDTL